MAKVNYYAIDIAQLHEKAAEIRLRAVESQLSLGFTLCATAETEVRAGHPEVARKLVDRLRHHANTISGHLDEPGHLPKAAITDLRKLLGDLEARTERVDASLLGQ